MTVSVDEIRSIIDGAGTMADMETLKNNLPLTEQEVDSLDMANIFLLIEEKFEIKVPDKDFGSLQSINNIVDYLNTK